MVTPADGTQAPDTPTPAHVLADAAEALHAERDLARLLAWAASAARQLAGADDGAYVALPAEGRPQWTTAEAAGSNLEQLGDPRTIDALAPAALGERPLQLDLDAEGVLPAGVRSAVEPFRWLLATPVTAAEGTPHGLLLVGGKEGEPEPSVEVHLASLARHLGVAIDNHTALAALEATQRAVVYQLQDAVLPPPPVLPNTELGRSYSGADARLSTGGDLYDWAVLPDGGLHFAIVDIMGKGVAATKDALAVTHVLRLLVLDGCPLKDVVRRADAILSAQNPELVATLIVGRYDPSTGRVHLAGGGHPPALLISDHGARELFAPGIPIGWPGAGSHGVIDATLGHGDSLVLYTDGLIESTRDIVAGLAALTQHAIDTASYPADSQARALIDRTLTGASRHDDSLAMVLRRRGAPVASEVRPLRPLEYTLSSVAALAQARHHLADWLRYQPVAQADAQDLLLVASELCSNGLRHASSNPDSVVLRAWVEGTDVILEVEDDGSGLVLPERVDDIPDPEAERGRGLYLVSALTDQLEVETSADGTRVRCTKRSVVLAGSPI